MFKDETIRWNIISRFLNDARHIEVVLLYHNALQNTFSKLHGYLSELV